MREVNPILINGILSKECTRCYQFKPLDEFYTDKRKKDGRQSECKKCNIKFAKDKRANDPEYRKKLNKIRRDKYANDPEYRKQCRYYELDSQKILDDLKIGFGCAICGFNEYPEALDFHHINPKDKKYQISMNKMTKDNAFDEIQKCMCLCKNCHSHITRVEKNSK